MIVSCKKRTWGSCYRDKKQDRPWVSQSANTAFCETGFSSACGKLSFWPLHITPLNIVTSSSSYISVSTPVLFIFQVPVIKYPDKSYVREEGFILPSNLKLQSTMVGKKIIASRVEAAGTLHPKSGCREQWILYSALSLYTIQDLCPGNGASHTGLPTSINLIKIIPYGHVWGWIIPYSVPGGLSPRKF